MQRARCGVLPASSSLNKRSSSTHFGVVEDHAHLEVELHATIVEIRTADQRPAAVDVRIFECMKLLSYS